MTDAAPRFPPQIRYIIGNEAAERFSFYGMRNILTVFLVDYLLARHTGSRTDQAQAVFHTFVMGVFLFPLLGGVIADWWWGKYRTVLWLSLVYVAGHACLAFFESSEQGFYTGLFLIALGSGGIKPCVSSFVGDQFTEANRALVPKVFGWFYWSINLGSFFASATIPKVLEHFGPRVAFGIPGVLMAIATVIFWAGRRLYVKVPPRKPDRHAFLFVLRSGLFGKAPGGFWDRARAEHPAEAVEGARAVLGVASIFAPIPLFWACFDQKASLWVLQARNLDLQVGSLMLAPSQLQAVNPLLVMLLVPLTTYGLYPWLERRGIRFTPLRRIGTGLVLTATSFVLVAIIQRALEGGARPSVLWQVGPYLVLDALGDPGLHHRPRVRVHPGTAPDEGDHHEPLAADHLRRQPRGGAGEEARAGPRHGRVPLLGWPHYLAALAFALIARRYVVRDHYLPAVGAAASTAVVVPATRLA